MSDEQHWLITLQRGAEWCTVLIWTTGADRAREELQPHLDKHPDWQILSIEPNLRSAVAPRGPGRR